MSTIYRRLASLLLAITCITALQAQDPPPSALGAKHGAGKFTANAGQCKTTAGTTADQVLFKGDGFVPTPYVCKSSEVALVLTSRDTSATPVDTSWTFYLTACNEASQVDPDGLVDVPGASNYYMGHMTTPAEAVHSYEGVVYRDVWPDIHWHWRTGGSTPRMLLECLPGSNPADIAFCITGQDSVQETLDDAIKLYSGGKWLEFREAIAYQVDANNDIVPLLWNAEYVWDNGTGLLTFLFDTYDPGLPLILEIGYPAAAAWEPNDPRNLGWSTYMGGDDGDEFMAADVDANGDVYVAGYTYNANFPIEPGNQEYDAANDQFMGSEDVVIAKFRADNKQLSWATYHGGSEDGGGAPFNYVGHDKAYDVAAYKGNDSNLEYVFATGCTANEDWPLQARIGTPFANADMTPMNSGASYPGAFISAYRQSDGRLDWSTALCDPNGDGWSASGMAIDVDEDGTLIWGGTLNETPDELQFFSFPRVIPAGAFDKGIGGGFFALMDEDYEYEWLTPFGSRAFMNGLYDCKITITSNGHKVAFVTGRTASSTDPSLWPLDVVDLTGAGDYYQGTPVGNSAGAAYMARLDLVDYQNTWCTYWDGLGTDMGLAVEVDRAGANTQPVIWFGGTTNSADIDPDMLVDPNMGLHIADDMGGFDGYLLRIDANFCNMYYGTLYGGPGDDAVLDIEIPDNCLPGPFPCQVYVTGESESATGLGDVQNGVLYYQTALGNTAGSTVRDAFILALKPLTYQPIWTTPYGGLHTDKGWGVACSATELFLVGGSNSDQSFFPLKEFDPNDPLDYYDDDLLNNVGNTDGYYWFNSQGFRSEVNGNFVTDTWPGGSHDAFIASFGINAALQVDEAVIGTTGVRATLLADDTWNVHLPGEDSWQWSVVDATGRAVQTGNTQRAMVLNISLAAYASGVYAVACTSTDGTTTVVKLPNP